MYDNNLTHFSPIQRASLLVCLVISIFFLTPILIGLAGLFVTYYGHSLYTRADIVNKVLGLSLIFIGILVFFSFGFPYALPFIGFFMLDKLLRAVGYPSLLPLLHYLLDSVFKLFDQRL